MEDTVVNRASGRVEQQFEVENELQLTETILNEKARTK